MFHFPQKENTGKKKNPVIAAAKESFVQRWSAVLYLNMNSYAWISGSVIYKCAYFVNHDVEMGPSTGKKMHAYVKLLKRGKVLLSPKPIFASHSNRIAW